METTQVQDTQQQPEPDLSFLEGTGLDTSSLAEQIKKEAAGQSGAAPAESAAPAPAATETPAVETKPEDTAATEETAIDKITIPTDVKAGDEIKAGEEVAPDGEYERPDKSVITIKDGKVETITPAETRKVSTEVIDNPFVDETETVIADPVNIKDFEEAAGYITSKTGLEVKSPADLAKVVARVEELNTSISSTKEEMGELERYKGIFESLPDDLFSIIKTWSEEGDYQEELRTVASMNLDFSKPFSSHDTKELVEHYNPGKFSKEDYEDMEDDKAMQAVVELTKAAYKSDQGRFKGQRDSYEKTAIESRKKFTASVDNSVSTLATEVPYLKDHHKQKVAGILKSGSDGILSLFVDEGGMLKPEAGKLVALAIYGEGAIASQRSIARNKGASEATEEIVRRTPTKQEKKSQQAGGSPGNSEQENLRKFQESVIPKSGNDNPFMKNYVGDDK